MASHANIARESKSQSMAISNAHEQHSSAPTLQLSDNRPETASQREMQEMASRSPQVQQAIQLQTIANNHSSQQELPLQKKENNTGLPDNLKSGIENLSGYALDDVKVYRNSDKPAQLQAHAYAQGTDIHLGPGQEKHLPHEAWHVVQQKQGRVRPTMQMKGKVNVNDDVGLEKEADVMGTKAMQMSSINESQVSKKKGDDTGYTVQRAVGFEFQTGWQTYLEIPGPAGAVNQVTFPKETPLYGARGGPAGWTMETDGRDIEFVIEPPFQETAAGVLREAQVMTHLRYFTDLLQQMDNVPRFTSATHPLYFNVGIGNGVVIEPHGLIRAQPQSTIGVKMERIQALFDAINTSATRPAGSGDFARDAGGTYPGPFAANVSVLVNGAANIHGAPPDAKLKGLLTLVVQYLVQGNAGGSRAYAKDMAYVMSRTDFASIFDRLSLNDKLQFRLNPGTFRAYALATAGMAGTGATRLINQNITDGGQTVPGVPLPVTRAQWLDGISSGGHSRDLFTMAETTGDPAYTDPHGGNRLRALGLLGNTFDAVGVGGLDEGVIMELRQMKRAIPATQWHAVTSAVLTYVMALNALPPGGVLPVYNDVT